MAYTANPFLERMSERTTSEQDFVRLFSPKVISQVGEAAFLDGISMFTSSPGAGKTTFLRAFTPSTLKAFWNTRHWPEPSEAYSLLTERGIIDGVKGPLLLGVLLTCASGYADLPRGATHAGEGLFRALLDCRVVLRAIRGLRSFVDDDKEDWLDQISLEYGELGRELKAIPQLSSCRELLAWAEQQERAVHADLDLIVRPKSAGFPSNVRFEGILWLQSIRFMRRGEEIAPKRLLMLDDLQRLRKKQRSLLIDEVSEMRLNMAVWLAERRIALGDELLSQGVREDREIRRFSLEDIWTGNKSQQFTAFAQNILDRRLEAQDAIPRSPFSQYLRDEMRASECGSQLGPASLAVLETIKQNGSGARYTEWVERAAALSEITSLKNSAELYGIRILIARDLAKRQLTLGLVPLGQDDLDSRDNSAVQNAAELFLTKDADLPYYYGIDRLCLAATYNVEELLSFAATLYDGLKARRLLRRAELALSPSEQERILRDVVKRKRDFIPKNHTEGTRAQRLIDAFGSVCRERTYLPNAPYAPGVTGLRLSTTEMSRLEQTTDSYVDRSIIKRVLSECVAENLLLIKPSSPSVGREGGTVFYLSRALCIHYRLPFQYGGWQDSCVEDFAEWAERGRTPKRQFLEDI